MKTRPANSKTASVQEEHPSLPLDKRGEVQEEAALYQGQPQHLLLCPGAVGSTDCRRGIERGLDGVDTPVRGIELAWDSEIERYESALRMQYNLAVSSNYPSIAVCKTRRDPDR